MNKIEKQVLRKFKRLVSARVPVNRMILFGSRARGDAEPYSDLDILVILEDGASEEVKDLVSDCAWEAGYESGVLVAPVVFTREEWEEGPERASLLALAVKADGIAL